jgi:hypothetical protein
MLNCARPSLVRATEGVGVENGNPLAELGRNRDDVDAQQDRKKMSIDGEHTQRQPMGRCLAQPVRLIETSDRICGWPATRHEEHEAVSEPA